MHTTEMDKQPSNERTIVLYNWAILMGIKAKMISKKVRKKLSLYSLKSSYLF